MWNLLGTIAVAVAGLFVVNKMADSVNFESPEINDDFNDYSMEDQESYKENSDERWEAEWEHREECSRRYEERERWNDL